MYILGEKIGEAALAGSPLYFVLTFPAAWDDQVRGKFRQACHNAFLPAFSKLPVFLMSEPEAAAMYSFQGPSNRNLQHTLAINDNIIVVNAGSSTLDITPYVITALEPVLRQQQTGESTGILCGSNFLDERFSRFLTTELGKEDGFDDEVLEEAVEVFSRKVKNTFKPTRPAFAETDVKDTRAESDSSAKRLANFIVLKLNKKARRQAASIAQAAATQAAIDNDAQYKIPVAGVCNNTKKGINRGRFSLKNSDLESVFDPVVSQAVFFINDYVKSSKDGVKTIFLVGSFSECAYFRERLRITIESDIVITPPMAEFAVVYGAVIKGLSNFDAYQIARE